MPDLFKQQQPAPYRMNPWNFPGQGQGEPGGLPGMIHAILQQDLYDPLYQAASVGDAPGANLRSGPIEMQESAEPHGRNWNQRELPSRGRSAGESQSCSASDFLSSLGHSTNRHRRWA